MIQFQSDIDVNKYKSRSDRKEYKLLTLTNGLEVLIVSTSQVKRNNKVSQKDDHDKLIPSSTAHHMSVMSPLETSKSPTVSLTPSSSLSDSASMKSAAALTVQIGSFADPEGCEGLAHFLEHMIFMGSQKYPGM